MAVKRDGPIIKKPMKNGHMAYYNTEARKP